MTGVIKISLGNSPPLRLIQKRIDQKNVRLYQQRTEYTDLQC